LFFIIIDYGIKSHYLGLSGQCSSGLVWSYIYNSNLSANTEEKKNVVGYN